MQPQPNSPRVILITGANGGLGQAIASTFLDEAKRNVVYLGVRSNRVHAEALAAEFPGRAIVVELDVAKSEAWQRVRQVIEENRETGGRLDVLVNNAGLHRDTLLGSMSPEDWRLVLESNLDGVYLGCRTLLPLMMNQRHGRIINISSLSALLSPPGQANYAAAKAGVIGLTQSLSKEVARLDITVNCICPGYVDTDALSEMSETEKKAMQARIPARRFGTTEEIAAAVQYFASAKAGYTTGATLKIDGGIL